MRAHDLFAYLEMLEDRVRLDAYAQAIDMHCFGKVIVDLGAGMGILSHLALRAGAERVYAIEIDRDALMVAYKLAQRMGYGERFVPLLGPSSSVGLPLNADVLVSETFDSFGIGEGGVGFILDAAQRLCKPGAVMIPSSLRVWLGLGDCRDLRQLRLRLVMAGELSGLDYRSFSEHLPPIAMALGGDRSLTDFVEWFAVELGKEDFPRERTMRFRSHTAGAIDAILGHFELGFGDGLTIATSRERPSTHWKIGVQPLPHAFEVEPCQEVELSLLFGEPDARGLSPFRYRLARVE